MHFWRLLFITLISVVTLYTVAIGGRFSIDTGLADVAPQIANNEHTKAAVSALRRDIEKRIILMVSGDDEEAVFDAHQQLTDFIGDNDVLSTQLTVLPSNDELVERVIEAITPYRFSLLSAGERERLLQSSVTELVEQAQRDAVSMSSARLLPFDQDPFGISSQSILEALQSLAPNSESLESDRYYQILGLKINGDALAMNQQTQLNQALNGVVGSIAREYGVQVDRSGVFFFATHAAQASKQDISLISTVSTVGVVLLLLFVFRSVAALLLPVVSIVIGVGFAFVATHAVFGQVHVLTIVFGASLVGIVIDYSLHYFYHSARFTCASTLNHTDRASEQRALLRALLLSLSTSLIGYAALSFSGLDALKKVALFSCCGLLMAWLCVVVLGNRLTSGNLVVDEARLRGPVDFIRAMVRPLTVVSAASVAVVLIVLALVSGWLFKPINDDPRVFFTAPDALLKSERNVAAVANDFEPGRYVIISGESLPELQSRFEAVTHRLVNETGLSASSISSILQFVPTQQAQSEAYQRQSKLYEADGALTVLAQKMTLSEQFVNRLRSEYQNAQGLTLSPASVQAALGEALPPMWFETSELYLAFALIRKGSDTEDLAVALKGLAGVEYVNTLASTQMALAQQRQSAAWLLVVAYLLVATLIAIRFNSINAATMVLVPMVSSAMLILLATPLGYQLNLFHVMALFLVLGFGMDYTIFVREMPAHQSKTLQAILLSAVTSLLSFGLLSVSSIPVVSAFGTALLIGNGFNLLGAFVYAGVLKRTNNPTH